MAKKIKQAPTGLILTPAASAALKGFAIIAVVVIHILGSFRISPFWNNSAWQPLAVIIDTLTRLSVPLFVALSGYGLSQKYKEKKLLIHEFISKRLFKLLPLYIGWSAFYVSFVYLTFNYLMTTTIGDFLYRLFWGRVDYHLYFVPMIFQLYLLFPLLLWAHRKFPKLLLVSAFLLQIAWLWQFSYHPNAPFGIKMFNDEVEKYVWSPNWIWYFVLGFSLPQIIDFLEKKRQKYEKFTTPAFILSWAGVSLFGLWRLREGMNALNVLRFTQYPTMVFATISTIILAWKIAKVKKIPSPLLLLGKYSYHIYLIHPLLLRLIWLYFK